ncbi:alkane 1-monooxygenase [Alkalimarinus sediminis]|uniref:Alkane 1-monooxygenase n=1 Tax=Alkalimarinus sediminis TaxID=1632866 RepID=A0A9E8HKC8_9ALTE|nr:alkane 1-monooxygenase [Alkalimarinus sediminis]UZW74952.1 alkane 1-monooxygenase [Alkalimarinus sediminis]
MNSAVTPSPSDLMGTVNDEQVSAEERKWAVAKRYWYLITLIVPAILIFSGVMAMETQSGQWLWLLTVVFFIVIPIVDFIFGADSFNPSEEEQETLKGDRFYVKILYAATALQWAGLVSMTWVVTQGDFSWFNILGAVLSVGAMHAVGLTMSHELGHKMNDKAQVLAAQICSACSGYAHFNIEHNKGHHKDVATPEDPASSRMGESLYQFALRELPGAARRGWDLEASRLKRQKRSVFSIHNELLQTLAITVVAYGAMVYLFGWMALPFLLITAAYGWFQLTMANYIEHYGLLRQTLENGRFERCQPHHSWNNNFKASNLLTLHLQRHSDHHAHPTRPYQLLRDYQDAPELPHGYPAMMGMAMIPSAWRMIMDHRVVEWAEGDMNKVNIDPAQREAIFSKFHNPKQATP